MLNYMQQQQQVDGEVRGGVNGRRLARSGRVQWMRRENERFAGRCMRRRRGERWQSGEAGTRSERLAVCRLGRTVGRAAVGEAGSARGVRVGAGGAGWAAWMLRCAVVCWLVGGVDAVGGSAGEASGIGAAAAVAAAVVGGFWAARVKRDWGDVQVLD
jgi:hypothetical protein